MRKSRVISIFGAALAVLLLSLWLTPRAEASTVMRVVDGDTLVVEINGEEETIRLLNVDAPETSHPSKQDQCLGAEATQWLTERLPAGTELELEFDHEKYDRYGRTLAAVYADGSLINAELASEGLGIPKTYGKNDTFRSQVDAAHSNAKSAQKGLFDEDIDCTIAAQQQTLEGLVDQLPSVPDDADPTAAVEEATSISEQIDSLAETLESGQLASAGLAIYDTQTFASTLSNLQADAARAVAKSQRRVTDLESALEDWEAEQERIKKEKAEKARAEAEAEEQAQQQEQQTPKPVSPQPAPAPRPTQNQAPQQPVPPAQRPSTPQTRTPAPPPAPAPEPKPTKTPNKKSSCVPYGPEISYANDGGYTGLRYGMPGGKTFRKCS